MRNDHNHHDCGVAFLFSSRVKLVVHHDLCEGHVESIWVEVFPRTKRSMLFCCVYRPPSQFCFFDKFLAECESGLLQCPQTTILGDMNADLLKPSCAQTKSLLSVVKQLQLVDLVNAPTRVTMTSSAQIDVLMTTDVRCFDFTRVYPFRGGDHHLIVSHFYARGKCVDPPPHKLVVVRNF